MSTPQLTPAIDLRSWADLRLFVYQAAPLIGTLLVSLYRFDQSVVLAWVAVVLAIVGPALAAIKTPSGARTWFYVVLGAVNAALVTTGILTDGQLDQYLPILYLVLGGPAGYVASRYTDTFTGSGAVVVDGEVTAG